MKKYEKPMLNVTRFSSVESIMNLIGGIDDNDGDIVNTGYVYESYPEIDDVELYFNRING